MIENSEYKLRQNNIYQYLKSIQHGETREIFYIQNFIPYSDLKFWNNFPEGEMQNIAKSKGEVMGRAAERIKIGLIIHPINDGKYIHGNRELWIGQKKRDTFKNDIGLGRHGY